MQSFIHWICVHMSVVLVAPAAKLIFFCGTYTESTYINVLFVVIYIITDSLMSINVSAEALYLIIILLVSTVSLLLLVMKHLH